MPHEYRLTRKDWFLVLTSVAAVIVACLLMQGCETVAGAGRDLTSFADYTAERMDNGFNRPDKRPKK